MTTSTPPVSQLGAAKAANSQVVVNKFSCHQIASVVEHNGIAVPVVQKIEEDPVSESLPN